MGIRTQIPKPPRDGEGTESRPMPVAVTLPSAQVPAKPPSEPSQGSSNGSAPEPPTRDAQEG